MGWLEYIIAFLVFMLSHSIPVRPTIKARITAKIGVGGFLWLYSLLSVGVLYWLIMAAGRAPFVQIWPYAPWQNHLPLAGMLGVTLLLSLSIARPNPFSFGGAKDAEYDPARAGITWLHRHPLLLALAIWAGVHLLPNGNLAHVILFVVLGGFALFGMRIIDRRKRQIWGDATHREMLAKRRPRPHSLPAFIARLALGGALYGALLWAHPWLFGVDPLF